MRDVAWCPNIGTPYDVIVSCHENHTAVFWKNDGKGTEFKKINEEKC